MFDIFITHTELPTVMEYAAAGGLFGLGFGFSLLSLTEIFYFLVVRWMFILYQKKKKKHQATITPTFTSVSHSSSISYNGNEMNECPYKSR